ncbi:MAG: hypothetical protein Q4E24_03480 [bacterium]|nr:hypothetical protein [bacterium]
MKKYTIFVIINLLIISFLLISCNQKEDSISQTKQPLELDTLYESEEYDFIFQYPSQWTIKEETWHPATKTTECDPEKTIILYIYGKEGPVNAYGGEEGIVIFDSMSRDGGPFWLVSGEEDEIVNVSGITGTIITEALEIEGQTWMQVLAYYENGYTEGIGMGGSYGACATVKKETYEQYRELIVKILESVHMMQS